MIHHINRVKDKTTWLISKGLKITSAGKDVEKGEPLHTVGGNVKWYNCHGTQEGGSSKS